MPPLLLVGNPPDVAHVVRFGIVFAGLAGLTALLAPTVAGRLLPPVTTPAYDDHARRVVGLRRREQQPIEINDNVLQGLVVAKMALELGETDKADRALTSAIDSASRMVTQLLGSEHFAIHMLRSAPAVTSAGQDPPPPGPGMP